MKKVRCLNGHFFDSDTYDKCPLCNSVKVEENDANGVESAKSVTQEKKHLFPWMKDNKKAAEIVRVEDGAVDKTFSIFGNDNDKSKPINEIKASDVRRWQAKLMSSPNNYSQTYLKKINTELNSIINYAKRFYDLNTNPCGKAGTIGKAKAEEMDYWTYDEYIAFREGVKDKPLSYICFEVLYWTGMREGELLALSPADIDLDNKIISINRTYQRIGGKDVFTSPKTRKSKRKIPIPDFLCQELSDYIQSRYMLDADERLFPVTKSYLSHEMIRGCKNTGVKKIRIHDIRHSHASLLINQGCDALMLADRLGHEKVSTTLNTYSHLFPHKQQELVHSLESLQATDSSTPEPPSDNPLLEAAGITCEVPQTQDNGSDVTIRPQFGPSLVPPNTASGKIIQMPQRKII